MFFEDFKLSAFDSYVGGLGIDKRVWLPFPAPLGCERPCSHTTSAFVTSLLLSAAVRDALCHHQCSCATFAFISILLALSPSLQGQCSLSLTAEVLPKIVGFSIPTEMEMEDEIQQSTGETKQ